MAVFWTVAPCNPYKLMEVSEVLIVSIMRVMSNDWCSKHLKVSVSFHETTGHIIAGHFIFAAVRT
jgi:hypothetical protein